ncbi:uracil-DNA glycosylase family protein [Halopseudomonas pelagia]|uniref:uracil-DNA glycosylase family protein n=1 Tax=Halopseudomonas pelagia TaxID=553151 RepID=UPI0003A458E0|nr:uracil-DNA glycosylase family protein [Halopseudomonas pelagia]
MSFSTLISQVRDCTLCQPQLPLGARPVVQAHPSARILITGQAPGRKVHESGIPFADASGERLRGWLGITPEVFYDARQIAILPMGFCYPGTGRSGDLPPRPECAPTWRELLMAGLPNIQLTLALGQYAQAYHFTGKRLPVSARVADWQAHWPELLALPHPSPRNNIWLRRHPWFEEQVIPRLRQRVAEVLAD